MVTQGIAGQAEDVVTGEADSMFEWVVAITVGWIVARFIIQLFDLDTRIEKWANWLRQTLGLP